MKSYLNFFFAMCGVIITYAIGEIDQVFIALCVAICVDYISGLVVALVFKNSQKTASGAASSSVCFTGLLKKIFMIVLVALAHQLDMALGIDFVRAGVVYAFLSNEVLSVIENATLMGIPVPDVIKKALDISHGKFEETKK